MDRHPPRATRASDEATLPFAAESHRVLARKISALRLQPSTIDTIAQRAMFVPVEAGQTIVSAHTAPDFLTFVVAGTVRVEVDVGKRTRPIVQITRPGQICGFGPLTKHGGPQRFAAVAHERSVVGIVGREMMVDVLRQLDSRARLGLLMYVCRGLSRLIHDRACLFPYRAEERVRRVLQHVRAAAPDPNDPRKVTIRLREAQLGAMAGLSREAVCRALGKLAGDGEIEHVGQHYSLRRIAVPTPATANHAPQPAAGRPVVGAQDEFHTALRRAWASLGNPARAIDALANTARFERYDPNDPIANHRHTATMLVQGIARIDCTLPGGSVIGIRCATPGQLIGTESTLADGETRQFTARALTPVLIAWVDLQDLQAALGLLDPEQMTLLMALYTRILSQQLYDRCALLTMTVRERLWYVLRALAAELGHARDGEIEIPIAFDGAGLAILLGARREPTATALAQAIRSGRVRRSASGSLVIRPNDLMEDPAWTRPTTAIGA